MAGAAAFLRCDQSIEDLSIRLVGSFAAARDPVLDEAPAEGTAVGDAVRGRIIGDLARCTQGGPCSMECTRAVSMWIRSRAGTAGVRTPGA